MALALLFVRVCLAQDGTREHASFQRLSDLIMDSLMQNVFEALTTALHREGHAFRARLQSSYCFTPASGCCSVLRFRTRTRSSKKREHPSTGGNANFVTRDT